MRRFWLALLAALLTVVALPSAAHAQSAEKLAGKKLVRRQAEISSFRGWASMSVGWRDAVNEKIRRKLLSGLPTLIVARAYIFGEDDEQPVSLSVHTCRVVFDLWDEVFRIELQQAGRKRKTVAVNVEGVMRRCAEARRLPLANMTSLQPSKRYFVGVLVEVNPLSKEMMDRIKRWVSRPRGAGAVGPGDSLFGSFVGLFVTHVPDADRVITFRTQSFVPAALPVVVEPEKDRRTQVEDDDDDERTGGRELPDPPPLPRVKPELVLPPGTPLSIYDEKYLPVEYDVGGRPAVVVGADELVASKVDRLLRAGAVVTVYACGQPVNENIAALTEKGIVALEGGGPDAVVLERAAVVFVAPAVADRVADGFRAARTEGRLWCTLDRPELSTFVNPAVVDTAGIALRLFSGGASPGLVRRLREDLEALLSRPELASFVARLASLRAALPRGERAARMRAAVRDFALTGELRFPPWFTEGTDPPEN